MKNPLTPAGIEPATFRFVAQHLSHCATAVPSSSSSSKHYKVYSSYNRRWRPREGVEIQFHFLFNLGTTWVWVENAMPQPLYPRERDPVLIVQVAGGAQGPIWIGVENFAHPGTWSPDRPTRSQLLYPRYPRPYFIWWLSLLFVILSSSSSSSSSPLCRVFILIFLRQTMSLGNTVLQLFCCYYS